VYFDVCFVTQFDILFLFIYFSITSVECFAPPLSAHLLLFLPPRTSSFYFKVVKPLHVVENSTRSACGRPGGARNGRVSARSIFRPRVRVSVDYIVSNHCISCWNCIDDVCVCVLDHWCRVWLVCGHFESYNVCYIFM
jgi:hypothetical protein